MAEARYEMLWDCPGCDTPKLLGLTHRHCPNCGAAQDPGRRYYPKDEDKIAVENHPFQGADRVCPACDTPNAAAATFCVNCGSDLAGAKAVQARAQQSNEGKASFDEDSAKAARDEALARRQAERAPAPPPAPKTGGMGLLALGVGFVGLVVCAGLALFLFWKKEEAFTVAGHRWTREVPVEELGPVQDSAWRDQVPSDARAMSCVQAERSTRKIADGEDCHDVRSDNGDGTFSEKRECVTRYREEPVYDDKCSFTVDRWHTSRTERAEGAAASPAPAWPAVSLRANEREGSRRETYTLRLSDPAGEERTCDLGEARWSTMTVGSRWKGEVGVLSGAVDCDTLTAP